jgi:hypothetical protein
LKTGIAEDIETFLKNGIPRSLNHMAVLKNTKKYLKQLKKDLTVAWSTISSELEMIPAQLFLLNPKTISLKDPSTSHLKFQRVENVGIEMLNGDEMFEIAGKSHILSVF